MEPKPNGSIKLAIQPSERKLKWLVRNRVITIGFILLPLLVSLYGQLQAQCTAPGFGNSQSACSTATVMLSATNVGLASTSGISHKWYTTPTGSGTVTPTNQYSPAIPTGVWISELTATFSSSVTYYVSTICSGVESALPRTAVSFTLKSPVSISINPSVTPPTICQGTSITLTPVNGSSYSWSASPGGTVTGSGAITVSPSANTTYTLSGVESNCNTVVTASIPVQVAPLVGAVSITSGPTSRCQGSGSDTYIASAANAGGFTWSLTAGAGSITTSGGAVTWNSAFPAAPPSGTAVVTVTANNGCGSSSPATRNVTVYSTPLAYTLNAPAGICPGGNVTIYLSGSQTGVNYQLYKDGNASGSLIAGTGSQLPFPGIIAIGAYTIKATGPGCPDVNMVNTANLVALSPGTLSASKNPGTTICQGTSVQLTASGGNSYTWTANTGGSWSGSPIPVTPSSTTIYTLYGNEANCGTPVNTTISVGVYTLPTAAASNQTICSGSSTSVVITNPNSVAGTTYTWSGGSAVNATGYQTPPVGSTSTISQVLSSVDGISTGFVTYTITPSANGCPGPTTTAIVTIKPTPQITNTSPQLHPTICSGTALNFTPTSTIGSTSYGWTSSFTGPISAASISATGSGAITNTPVNTGTVAGTVTYHITPTYNSCPGLAVDYVVTVNPLPASPSFTVPPTPICGSKILSRGSPTDGSTWYWQGTNSNGTDQSGGAAATTYTASVAGTNVYYLRALSTSGCWSTTGNSVTVNPIPAAPAKPVASVNTCDAKTLTKGTPPNGVDWYWQGTNASGQDYTSSIATAPTFTVTANNTYYLSARSTAGCWSLTSTPLIVTTNPVDLTISAYDPVNTIVQATRSVRLLPGFATTGGTFKGAIAISPECNDYVNWSETSGFDQNGQKIARSRTYSDGLGNQLQSQSIDFLSGKVWATQPLYDNLNKAAGSTLPAPILENDFVLKRNFVQNATGQWYSAADFDQPISTGAAGEVNNPNTVGNQPGSLGWYYSTSNNLEVQTPTTTFPYSRSYTPAGPNPTTSKSAGAGNFHHMGTGHESKSDRYLISSGELTHYYSLRGYFSNSTTTTGLGYKNIGTDPDGKQTASFTDADGHTVATALVTSANYTPNPPVFTYDYWSYTYYNDAGQVTATVAPQGVIIGNTSMPNFVTTYQYDQLGRVISTTSPDEGTSQFVFSIDGKIRFSQNAVQLAAVPKRFSYTNYDYLGRLIESGEYTQGAYVFEPATTLTPGTGSVLTIVNSSGYSGTAGNVDAGATSDVTKIYYDTPQSDLPAGDPLHAAQKVLYGQVAKTSNSTATTWYSYDEFGQLAWTKQSIGSTPPVAWTNLTGVVANGSNLTKTAGTYAWDAGAFSTGSIPASTNGYVEFSAGEVNTHKFIGVSGTDGGPNNSSINFGIYFTDTGSLSIIENVTHRADNISTYTTADVLRVERQGTTITYKKNGALLYTSPTSSSGALYADCSIFTPNATIKNVMMGGGGFSKTIDYAYDYFGNVTQVAYQRGQPDAFYHHYVYDINNSLVTASTSKDGVIKTLQATYYYYLHGPVKRVELAGTLQGIDYVYNINGSLKSINGLDATTDPGKDGVAGPHNLISADVFGLSLDYYNNDYVGAGASAASVTASGLTDSFSGLIKSASWYTPVDYLSSKKIYGYSYDSRNQFQNAKWATLTGSSGNYSTIFPTQAYNENIPLNTGYDKNGNILSLTRKDKGSNTIANYTYSYASSNNKLNQVNNSGAALTTYTYNAIGQMTRQVEGSNTMNLVYNAYGLVKEVRDGSNNLIESLVYDDHGGRFQRVIYTSGIAVKNTFYVRDVAGNVIAAYDQKLPGGPMQLIELPIYGAGRLGEYKPVSNTYFYELNDHLGNVRAVIGAPHTDIFLATMESEVATAEDKQFKNIAPRSPWVNGTVTPPALAGNEAVILNGTRIAGPGIVLRVAPGDMISAEVYAYYEGCSNCASTQPLSTIITAIAGIFQGVSGAPGDPGKIYSAFNSTLSGGTGAAAGSGNNAIPGAHLNMIMLDGNMLPDVVNLPNATAPVTIAANWAKQKLTVSTSTPIPVPGYVYIYFNNNSSSSTPVYFDDLKVTQLHSPYVAGGDYYPFGLAMDDRQIKVEPYRFGYQGQYAEKDTLANWNAFQLRMYEPRFGRWLSVDPKGQFSSPYLGMGNNPISGVDPDGGGALDFFKNAAGKEAWYETAALAAKDGFETLVKKDLPEALIEAALDGTRSGLVPTTVGAIEDAAYQFGSDKQTYYFDNSVLGDRVYKLDGQKNWHLFRDEAYNGRKYLEDVQRMTFHFELGVTIAADAGLIGLQLTQAIYRRYAKSFFAGTKYTDKVLAQMKSEPFHGFPESVKAFEEYGVVSYIKGGDNVVKPMLSIPGEYGGRQGFFEFMKEADGSINHRFFRPN